MQTFSAYIWDKLHLHGRKIILPFLLVFFLQGYSQQVQQNTYDRYKRRSEVNLPNYDEKFLHYGFFIGLNYNRVAIDYSKSYLNDVFIKDTITKITPKGEGGFALGFLLNIRLHDQFAFKLVPSVGFYNWNIDYTLQSGEKKTQTSETTFIELQFLFKYRSMRRGNTRMYLIGGVKPAIRVGGKKADPGEEKMGFNRLNLSIDYGAGFELYFPYFKWSPELRFSHGLINMNTPDNNDFNKSLSSILTHTVTLYFFFE